MLIGLVGKPSSGKSTFFKASTLADVEIANYPFTTIKPNHGITFVSIDCVDKEFNKQCIPREGYCINHKRFISIELLDVAGLVPGAYEGKGKGNQFLDDLRQADAFIHIIDVSGSTDENGNSVPALAYDPCKDIEFLDFELDMWYYQILMKGWGKFSRQVHHENLNIKKALAEQLSGLKVTEDNVEKSIKKYAALAGLPIVATPHTLRHTYATDLLGHGADLRSVQELLGHKNVSTTQVYTHVTNKQLRDIHEKFHGGKDIK